MNETAQRRPLAILWRGPLDSCNYACSYCPFAKHAPTTDMLARDQRALTRFVDWVRAESQFSLRILFTPYGEALIWPHYQQALVALSQLEHVEQVSIQTNGSGKMDFLADTDLRRVSLWISWHPTEIDLIPFAQKIAALHQKGVQMSIGAVAVPAHLEQMEALRREIPLDVPMWLNAEKPGVRYADIDRERWRNIDPDFDFELRRHRSAGQACTTGNDSISVDGDGEITRCHFVNGRLGNLYHDDLATLLGPSPCPRRTCECWIGYVHLSPLGLAEHFPEVQRLARIRKNPAQMR